MFLQLLDGEWSGQWAKKVKGSEVQIGCYRIVMGCKVQHREYSSQRTYMHDPCTWTMCDSLRVWGQAMWKGVKDDKLGQL